MDLKSPIVEEVKYNAHAIQSLETAVKGDEKKKELILDYPTDYIIYTKRDVKTDTYEVYVGETNDIGRRTLQHLNEDPKERPDWDRLSKKDDISMLVIGHEHFNKSLTLDIENRLMLYLGSVDSVKQLDNRRTNSQSKYFTSDEMEPLFTKIWRKLRVKNKTLFPVERVIRDSAVFKASPFHSLTKDQAYARELIMNKVTDAIGSNKIGQMIFVEGEAGSGKTVLLSSLFYLLSNIDGERPLDNYLLVNHNQQLTVYQQIAKKLGLDKENPDIVSKPTRFINNHSEDAPVDVVLIDEAHLLWTQGKQSYQGNNQLEDILKRARVVIVIFDKHQTLTTEEYWEEAEINQLRESANKQGNLVQLKNQMRMDASAQTINWIKDFVYGRKLTFLPKDDRGYDLRVMKSPEDLEKEIKKHAGSEESDEHGLSRMLATFDWEYIDKKKPKDGDEHWDVKIGEWEKPWNLQIEPDKELKLKNRGLSWAEQPQTINEIGSTYTIQGFDLNYSGVIIGPSVTYRHGKVVFNPDASFNSKATRRRTLKDNSKVRVADQLLANELNVLLTRGVHGLYIYAVDEALQKRLLEIQDQKDNSNSQ